jgi:hypothetical protein
MPNRQISHADRADGGSAVVRSLSVQIQLLRSSCHWEDLFNYTQKKYVSFGPHKTRVSTELTLRLQLELLWEMLANRHDRAVGPCCEPYLHYTLVCVQTACLFPFRSNWTQWTAFHRHMWKLQWHLSISCWLMTNYDILLWSHILSLC